MPRLSKTCGLQSRVQVVYWRHFSGLHGFGSHFQIKYWSGPVPCSIFTGLFGYELLDPWRPLINTTAVTETPPPFFAWTFGQQYTNISTSWFGLKSIVFEWAVLDQPSLLDRINPFVGDFVTLQIVYMHKQLHNTLNKRKTRNASYDPFKLLYREINEYKN